ERAEKLYEALLSEALARSVQENREVAVMALEQGQIALRHTGGTLALPVASGSGEEGCRFVLRAEFGSADGQVRLLGTVAAAPGRPLLEVWLVRRLGGGLAVPAGMQIQWVPLTEVVVRVAALKRALQADDGALSDDGLTAREQLDAIVIRLRAQLERYAACWLRQCLPALAAQGIRVRGWSGLSEPERARLRDHFTEQ